MQVEVRVESGNDFLKTLQLALEVSGCLLSATHHGALGLVEVGAVHRSSMVVEALRHLHGALSCFLTIHAWDQYAYSS